MPGGEEIGVLEIEEKGPLLVTGSGGRNEIAAQIARERGDAFIMPYQPSCEGFIGIRAEFAGGDENGGRTHKTANASMMGQTTHASLEGKKRVAREDRTRQTKPAT